MRLIFNLMIFLVFIALLGAAVFYNQEISSFSKSYLSANEGVRALKSGNWTRAMTLYEAMVKKNENDMAAALSLAKIYHHQIQTYAKDGVFEYTAGTELKPLKKRKTVLEMKQQATALFDKVLENDKKSDKSSIEARIAYVQYLQDTTTRLDKAVKIYKEVLKDHPQNAELLGALGDLYKVAAENPQETRLSVRNWLLDWSIYYYRQALRLAPNLFQSRFNLGVVYHSRNAGNTAEKDNNLVHATREYCNALQVKTESYEARYNLGLALVDLGAVEPGFRELARSVNILAESGQVPEAQQLAQQIQAVRNGIYYEEPQDQIRYEDLTLWPWLPSCVGKTSDESDG